MLRRPTAPASSIGTVAGTAVLTRRGSARATPGGTRRRTAGLDVPVAPAGGTPAEGVVPRMRRPRTATEPVRIRTALEARIDRHLARLHGHAPAARPGAIDDERARIDPETTSFAAIRPTPAGGSPAEVPAPARVATAADRPRTAEFPAAVGAPS